MGAMEEVDEEVPGNQEKRRGKKPVVQGQDREDIHSDRVIFSPRKSSNNISYFYFVRHADELRHRYTVYDIWNHFPLKKLTKW